MKLCCKCDEDWSIRGIKLQDSKKLKNKELHELVAASSTNWTESPLFDKAKLTVDSIKVVNDSAERSVALMSSYNKSITKTETEMQRLLQVVEDNRKRIPHYMYKKANLK